MHSVDSAKNQIENHPQGRAPFGDTLDSNDWYSTPEISQRLNLLKHLAQSSNLVLVVLGPAGAGKTYLMNTLLGQLDERCHTCVIHGTRTNSIKPMMRELAECCDIPVHAVDVTLAEPLAEFAVRLNRTTRIPLIVVDDAHLLPEYALQFLIQLSQSNNKEQVPWHVVLFGEQQLQGRLCNPERPLLQSDSRHIVTIPSLTLEETGDYLRHRLQLAGWSDPIPFSRAQVRTVFKNSHGLPGAINICAQKLLNGGPGSRPETNFDLFGWIPSGLPWLRITIALFIAIILGSILLFEDQINQLAGTSAETPTTEAPPSVHRPLEPAKTPVQDEPVVQQTVEEKPADPIPEPVVRSEPPALAKVEPPTREPVKQAQDIETTKQSEAVPAKPDSTQPPDFQSPLKQGQQPNTGAAPDENTAPISEKETKPTPLEKPIPVQQTTPLEPASPGGIILYGEHWLRSAQQRSFTLQLLGAHQEATIQQYINKHGLRDGAAYYRILYRNKDWYVLVYGEYPNQAAAKQGIGQLPPSLKSTKPWIRSVRLVQEEIRHGYK